MLFAFRMLQGAISGFISAALALVSTTTPRERTGYAIGILQTSSSSGSVIGPLIGGSLADAFGYRPIFFIVAALCTVAGILVVTMVKETGDGLAETRSSHSLVSSYRYSFSSKPIRVSLALIFLTQAAILMTQPVFALYVEYLKPNQEYLSTIAGAAFSVAGLFMVFSSPWWGKRNDLKSYRKNLSMAVAVAAFAYILQGLVGHVYQLMVFRAVQGLAMGGILPTLYSYVSKNSDVSRRGSVMGIASSSYILASMIGPISGGYLAAQIGLREIFFVSGSILAATLLLIRRSFVDMRGAEPHPPPGPVFFEKTPVDIQPDA
jgi:MFS family permease